MKTIREHFEQLPEPYRTEAIENTKYDILGITEYSIADALLSAFTWDNTKQGYMYWSNLCAKLENK